MKKQLRLGTVRGQERQLVKEGAGVLLGEASNEGVMERVEALHLKEGPGEAIDGRATQLLQRP